MRQRTLVLTFMMLYSASLFCSDYMTTGFSADHGAGWTNWQSSNVCITLDYVNFTVEVHSKQHDLFKILRVYPGLDRFATSTSHYYALDKKKLHCNLDIVYFIDGLIILTVQYGDYSYKYKMYRMNLKMSEESKKG